MRRTEKGFLQCLYFRGCLDFDDVVMEILEERFAEKEKKKKV